MSLGTDVLSRTVRTQKLFNFQVGKCFYANIEASKKNEQNEEEPIIKILNTICKEKGSCLSKVTEIRFREKLIVIEDQYVFGWHDNLTHHREKTSSQPTKSSDGSSQSNNQAKPKAAQLKPQRKKKLIFKKRFHEDHTLIQKRNTKNIAKNFCKAFVNFLEENKIEPELTKAKKIMQHYNYNNHTIEALGRDSHVRQCFIVFLKEKASDWVEGSKIHDKLIHKQAIQLYLDLLQNIIKFSSKNEFKEPKMMKKKPFQIVEASASICQVGADEIFQEENNSGK